MRRSVFVLFPALSLFLTASSRLSGLAEVAPADAPRADARLLRALNSGAAEVGVILGVRDGTPSARTLRMLPDPEGEPARRIRRLAAQYEIADEMPPEDFRVSHFYESFSILAGTASRAGAVTLANRPDVAWVTIDGTKKPLQASAQSSQVLIHSDQTNALGYTGLGQTIAVVDTGVDYTINALGGGPFPNAKVIGGTDTADNDNDPMDCEGHGTSVAAIIASSQGVAPDAKIVAIKVFSSKDATNASCKDQALDSDILAGINWAITNRDRFGIGVVNISLGGSFGDKMDHGYCDADLPSYATAFDSTLANGIVVVVAAGNDGTSNALSAPACLSSAVSVGAVYADARARASWLDGKGNVQCTDSPTAPDQIVCFSDSSTTLSLLAPGAFWIVATKGGGLDSFSGTSAACPAAAGAAALLRQARPGISPAAVAEMLRVTGKPITDQRNGVTTPRLDTFAAVSFSSASFFPFIGTPEAIPDGNGSASASVTVSGFTGGITGVQAVVQIDHPDPEQLRVTLKGPDGTTVLLHDHTGLPQHPINAIYGKTDAPAQSLGAFQGHPANGVWTLTVEDTVKDTASPTEGRIQNFAIVLLPGQPIAAIPQNVSGRVLPLIAHVFGTKFFQSDIRLYNPSPAARDFSLYFVPLGQSGATASRATATIGPGRVLALNDVIANEYSFSDSFGPITVTTTDTGFLVSGRNYTVTPNGSFGLAVPGFPTQSGLSYGGGAATANGLVKSAEFHTNVGFTEVSGAPVTVRMDVLDQNGATIGSTTGTALPNTTYQLTDIIGSRGLPPTSNFRVDYTVTSPTGRIIPYATYVDDFTGDSVFRPALTPASTPDDVILPQAAHVTGANGDFFKTDVAITNLEAQPVTITVTLLPLLITGTPAAPRLYTLGPGQTLQKLDILASEFGLADPSAAGLRIHPDRPARIVVSNNTYVQKFGGTFGFSISGVPASAAAGVGSTVTAIQLDQTTAPSGSRCNFGFAEVGGANVVVQVTARSGDTGQALGAKQYVVPANTLFQTSSQDVLGQGVAASNFYMQYSVVGGAGRIFAYATVNDNTSGDAIYIPAE